MRIISKHACPAGPLLAPSLPNPSKMGAARFIMHAKASDSRFPARAAERRCRHWPGVEKRHRTLAGAAAKHPQAACGASSLPKSSPTSEASGMLHLKDPSHSRAMMMGMRSNASTSSPWRIAHILERSRDALGALLSNARGLGLGHRRSRIGRL